MTQENNSRILDLDIVTEVEGSFLDYAVSVITSRALPDVRDGLKPVHRRILHALNELKITPSTPYKKSARIVGEIIGKYHPHGDTAVYLTMVRMAQDFSLRYPFVDGHGNYGSIDGDSPAAMRYTEARMTPLALEMLKDIEKNTVNMSPNYDGEEKEPDVLPAKFPNLILNGVQGIAVGMATNMPSHNMREVISAILYAIDHNEEYTVEDIIKFIPGPDFPTGGIITNGDSLADIYRTGKGSTIIESKWHTEELKGGKTNIILTELPYMCNKATLITQIADLVREKKVDGISDLRDESDREGIRVVIEIKRDAHLEVVLEKLMKYTNMRSSFPSKFLVLNNKKPVIMDIKQLIQAYIDHQVEILTRRTNYNLDKLIARIHILKGLIIAQTNIDDVVRHIKAAGTSENAKLKLQAIYKLSEEQATAIISLRLSSLTGLEVKRLNDELIEKEDSKQECIDILSSRQNILNVLKSELEEFVQKYGDERRTQIITKKKLSNIEEILETIPDEKVLVSITHNGYIKRSLESDIVRQRRGNKGRAMTKIQEEDFVSQVFSASTRDSVLVFTGAGMSYKLNIFDIPDKSKNARGTQIGSLLERELKDKIQAIVPISNTTKYLILVTEAGFIKKLSISEFSNITKTGLTAMYIRSGDSIKTVVSVDNSDEILLCTASGNAIRFSETWLESSTRDSYGVVGAFLEDNDYVVDADVLTKDSTKDKVVVVTADGYGKLVDITDYRSQRHGGKGVRTTHTENSKGALVGFKAVSGEDEIVIVTGNGEINRQPIDGILEYSRYAQGVKLINLSGSTKVVSISTILAEDEV